mmetsp:Transcript_13921/g.16162  ORF Transcript_13921/g.16162 Transcript_13921/m.16162 type:complete len:479 (+) Transcript_13921:197-1633(+)|eukprot:CAMPEP_0204823512 /NCGR_PEP_ID=MMETSP1346-20131115/1599_1 /ASSEMBLY_ACC=CAM_ASM_000771 /TAXON_ID=215587 /ORGANISM="Aplanochytrium stocchinoi, Strain GSBS06" /LENGTH=478 /DNA_ID=CAMNT_0051950185 /DNA_START=93 /DNA_END=1529 /DNA_ORIENTATION=-
MAFRQNVSKRLSELARHQSSQAGGNSVCRLSTSPAGQTANPKLKSHYKLVIVGGGNASGYACMQLVNLGVGANEVAVITEEPVVPYERPALTKAYLHPPDAKVRARLPGFHTCAGWGKDRQTREWYSENGIDIVTDTKVTKIDVVNKTLNTNTGDTVNYEKILFATGARAIKPSEIGLRDDLQNVFILRDERECGNLVSHLEENKPTKAVVIGGGYIGMECAAGLGGWKNVDSIDVVFPESHLMQRLFPKEVADWFEEEFKRRNINLIKGTTVTKILGENGKVEKVELSNGQTIETNLIIAGIGAKPNTDLLKGKVAISEDGGIKVDSTFQSSDPAIYACGDVASFPHLYFTDAKHVRFEHVDNCRRSAVHAATCMINKKSNYEYSPFFYSRLFEYGDSPVVFNFYGNQEGPDGSQLETVTFGDKERMGAFWIDNRRNIQGAMICNGTQENYNEIAEIAKTNPRLLEGESPISLLKTW